MLNEKELIKLANAAGFHAAVISPELVPIKKEFRAFCEENRCGKYGANYSCPPDCGTIEELQQRILAEKKVLVVQTCRNNIDKTDKDIIGNTRTEHNAAIIRFLKSLRQYGYSGFCAGYGGCSLCTPCLRIENQPCRYPDLRISCMSAYCVDVAVLAEQCGLEFSWEPDKLFLFGMFAIHES